MDENQKNQPSSGTSGNNDGNNSDIKEQITKLIDKIISFDKKNLFNKILIGIMTILSINILYILFLSYRMDKAEKVDDLGSAFAQLGEITSTLKKLGGAISFQQFLLFIFIINLVFIFLKLKKNGNWKKIEFILPSISATVLLIGHIFCHKLIKILKIMSGNIDIYKILDLANVDEKAIKLYSTSLKFILILTLFFAVVSIAILAKYIKENKSDNSDLGNDIKINSDEIKDAAKKEFQNTANQVKTYKKPIIIVVIALCVVFAGFYIFNTIKYKMSPDAVIDTSNMKICIDTTGANKYGVANAYVKGFPKIEQIKKGVDKSEVSNAISDYKVKLSKKDNLKNGDKIVATVKFSNDTKLKIKFNNGKPKKTLTVKGLINIVSSYEKLPKKVKDRMEEKGMLLVKNHYMDDVYKDVEIKKVKAYEIKLSDNKIKELSEDRININDAFKVCFIYDVKYKEKEFLSDEEKEKDKFVCVNFTNFVERNSEVNFNSRVDGYFLEDSDNLEDVDVKLKIDDYSEIK